MINYEEFQHLARLYIVGALDEEEMTTFEEARGCYGEQAEAFIDECQKLNALFALSLLPSRPSPGLKERLMAQIRSGCEEVPASAHREFFGLN